MGMLRLALKMLVGDLTELDIDRIDAVDDDRILSVGDLGFAMSSCFCFCATAFFLFALRALLSVASVSLRNTRSNSSL